MAERLAVLVNALGVVGGVHGFVEIGDPRSGHGHERDGGLGVVQGGRGEDAGDGDLSAGDVDMGFVSGPAFLETFAVFLGSDVAFGRQIGAHLRESLAGLTLRGGAGWSLRGRPGLRGGAGGGGGSSSFAAGFSLASISVASRATTPTMRPSRLRSTSALWMRSISPSSANSWKARENVGSEGISARLSHPQMRRTEASTVRRSMSARVVGNPRTALATKARAMA